MSYQESSHIAGNSDNEGQVCAKCGRGIGKIRQFTIGQRVGLLQATASGAVAVYPVMNPTNETPKPCRP